MKSGVYGISDKNIDIITYVPKCPEEYKIAEETGARYNQARELARHVARYLDKTLIPAVIKIHPLRLSGLGFQERYDLCRRVYKLNTKINVREYIKGMNVAIVDDVRTTGATGNTIAELLKEAGANRVYLLVAGRSTHKETFDILLSKHQAD